MQMGVEGLRYASGKKRKQNIPMFGLITLKCKIVNTLTCE